MTREETKTVRVTCDGCGSTAQGDGIGGRWRRLTLQVETIPDDQPLRRVALDLCPRCLGRIVVPGLETKVDAEADRELRGAVA